MSTALAATPPVVLGLVLLVWIYRTLSVYSPRARGPVVSTRDIPDAEPQGLVSVIVPAKDEEANIGPALETLLAQDYPDLEILVVDDRSTDRTAEVVRRVAERDGRVRLLQVTDLPAGWFGKPHAMHVGASAARGRWLLFVDADCRQAPQSVRAGVHFAAARGADLLTLWPILELHGFWEHLVQPVAGSVLAAWFPPGRVNDPRRRTAFANGQYILMRREVYEATGGYEAVRGELNEDVAIARHVKSLGYRLVSAVGDGVFTTRMYDSLGAMYRGWARIYCGAFRRPSVVLVVFLGTLMTAFLPFAALPAALATRLAGAGGAWATASAALAAGACLLALVTMRRLFQLGRANPWYLVLYPLAVAVVMVFEAGALVRALGLRPVTWRGTTYKAGRLVDPGQEAGRSGGTPGATPG